MFVPKLVLDLSEAQLAWFAGIIDGEGTIRVSGVRRKYGKSAVVQIQLSNTSPELLLWIKTHLPGCGSFRFHGGKTANSKSLWKWEVVSRQAEPILRGIQPFLLVKRAQADLALLVLTHGVRGKGKRPSAEVVSLYDNAITTSKILNSRGTVSDAALGTTDRFREVV